MLMLCPMYMLLAIIACKKGGLYFAIYVHAGYSYTCRWLLSCRIVLLKITCDCLMCAQILCCNMYANIFTYTLICNCLMSYNITYIMLAVKNKFCFRYASRLQKHNVMNKRPRGLDALFELKTQYAGM